MLSHENGGADDDPDAFVDASSTPNSNSASASRRQTGTGAGASSSASRRSTAIRTSNVRFAAEESSSDAPRSARASLASPAVPQPASPVVGSASAMDLDDENTAEEPVVVIKQEKTTPAATPSRSSKRYSTTPGGMVTFAEEARLAATAASPSASVPTKQEPAEPTPRLIMTKMVLMNFKSYAGRIEIGPFHEVCFRPVLFLALPKKPNAFPRTQSFTSIVGPNGSGKSNVIDALLFVFGWAAKKLRHAKVEHLIHNSAKFPNLPSCTVEVYFEEVLDSPVQGVKPTKIQGSELVVARTGTRSGGSQYQINGRNKSREEVRDTMKSKGVDLDHNRFLILQVGPRSCWVLLGF